MSTENNTIKIIQTVASGGTAVMYKAVQTSLDRIVAVKRLHAHLTDDENFTRRFILEAKAAASLDHENIVHVIDFGREGDCYQMVMEYVEGESLKEVLERWRPIRYELSLAIVHQVLLGLEHAHSKGIVHRDIKPGNIMLTNYGKAKITDFGLAKLTQSTSSHTAANSIMGTPLYMSPEQAFGESVDQRSDLFSLGTMLYELLTGKQPFASENYMGVIQNILNKDVPPLRRTCPEIPAEVEAIVSRALSRAREERFQTARDFRLAIEDLLGIVRLNEASASLRVLLERQTHTQILPGSVLADGAYRSRSASGRAVAAIAAVLLLGGGTALVLTQPAFISNFIAIGDGKATPVQQSAGVVDLERFDFDMDGAIAVPGSTAAAAPIITAAPTVFTEPESARVTSPEATPVATPTPTPTTAPAPEKSEPREIVKNGFVSIATTPPAEVYIDGVYQGDSPIKASLRAGMHSIECRLPQFETYSERVRIINGELSRRNIALKKLKGIISLATQEGAEVYIDGSLLGTTPILRPIEVDAGSHMVTIKKSGFFTWSSEVTVESTKTLPLRITLSERY